MVDFPTPPFILTTATTVAFEKRVGDLEGAALLSCRCMPFVLAHLTISSFFHTGPLRRSATGDGNVSSRVLQLLATCLLTPSNSAISAVPGSAVSDDIPKIPH